MEGEPQLGSLGLWSSRGELGSLMCSDLIKHSQELQDVLHGGNLHQQQEELNLFHWVLESRDFFFFFIFLIIFGELTHHSHLVCEICMEKSLFFSRQRIKQKFQRSLSGPLRLKGQSSQNCGLNPLQMQCHSLSRRNKYSHINQWGWCVVALSVGNPFRSRISR